MNFNQLTELQTLLSNTPDIDNDNHASLYNEINENNNNQNNRTQSMNNTKSSTAGIDPLFKTIIKTNNAVVNNTNTNTNNNNNPITDNQSIWTAEEIHNSGELIDDPTDNRLKPAYEILYGQKMSTEDIYLNGTANTTINNSIDPFNNNNRLLILRIDLPNITNIADINIEFTINKFLLTSSLYKLFLHLPHQCDYNNGIAQFDSKLSIPILTIKLPIIEADY